jgi:hypothetical protein
MATLFRIASDLWEYFQERADECERLGLFHHNQEPQFVEKGGSGGRAGRINLDFQLTDQARFVVMEVVSVGNGVHREEYAYYLLIDGQEYWARDFDEPHGYHGHGVGHERIEADRISFKDAVAEVWRIVEIEEWLEDAD